MEHPKIIGVDFDNTLVKTDPDDHRTILGEIPRAFETLRDLREAGFILVLWTCRCEEYLDEALQFCREHNFEFDAVNENWSGIDFQTSCKPYFDWLIDDHNFGCNGVDWDMVRSQLLKEGDEEILWKGNFISVVSPREHAYEAVAQQDSVMCILHDKLKDTFFVRQELVPPYEYRTGRPYWYTLISGGVEEGETPKQALIREVKEEAGVLLSLSTDLSISCLFQGPLNKTLSNFGYFYFVEGVFARTKPTTDGTAYEACSMTTEISRADLMRMAQEHSDFLLVSGISMILKLI